MYTIEAEKISTLLTKNEDIAAMSAEDKSRWGLTRFQGGGQELFYFSVVHSYARDNPMFTAIEKAWRHFLDQTNGQKRIILFEGRFKFDSSDRDAIITKGGESALIRYLANRDGVEEFWPEPNLGDEIGYLCGAGFADEEIFGFYFVRALAQWHRAVDKGTPESYLARYFDVWHTRFALDKDIDFSALSEAVERIAGEKLPIERQNSLQRIISGNVWQSRLNDVARLELDFRDVFIVQQIYRLWQEGNSIFMVYGNAHLIRQEPALIELLGLTKLPATEVLTKG